MARSNLNVVFIARNYPPAVGGAEKLNYDLSKKLEKLINFKVIVNKWSKRSPVFYTPIFYILSFFKIIFDKKVDIILLSDGVLAPLIPFLKVLKRRPIAIKIHGFDITFNNKMYQAFIPAFVNMTDKVICISEATKKECVKRGIDSKKCTVIPIGIDSVSFQNVDSNVGKLKIGKILGINIENKKVILSTGALVRRKGIYWFVNNVIPGLLEKRNDFIYLVAGGVLHKGQLKDYRYREQIESIIKNKHLKNHVYILGKVSDKDLKLLYQLADIFVMPNIPVKGDMEGFGIVVLEASSYGLPVVASNLEGIKDVVKNRKNGFLIKPEDSNQFVEVINKLLENNKQRKEFGRQGKIFTLENYKWDGIIKEYLKQFKSLVNV